MIVTIEIKTRNIWAGVYARLLLIEKIVQEREGEDSPLSAFATV